MKRNRLLLLLFLILTACVQSRGQAPSCNSLATVYLDVNCEVTLTAEQMLEFPCGCPLGTTVQIDKTLPYGNGPWVAPILVKADIGKTYQARVTDISTGDKCWGNVTVFDTLGPVMDCSGLTTVELDAGGSAILTPADVQVLITDACSNPGTITVTLNSMQSSVSYSCAKVGLNTLTVHASDSGGNASSCETTVLVTDPFNACITGCLTACPPAQPVPFSEGFGVLLPAWNANDFTPFDAYGSAEFDQSCVDSDTLYSVTYLPSFVGQNWFIRTWDVSISGVPFGKCVQTVTFPNTQTLTFSGTVFLDSIQNCQLDAGEAGIGIFNIIATKLPGNQEFSVNPNADGTYTLDVETDATDSVVLVHIELPNGLTTACPTVVSVPADTSQLTHTIDFGLYSEGICPLLQVSAGALQMRRCDDNTYFIQYCNLGYEDAMDAYLTLELDTLMTLVSADKPYTNSGKLYTFQLDTVARFSCHTFSAQIAVGCDAGLGQTLCTETTVYPHEPCDGAQWNGPVILARASCEGDSVRMVLENAGIGNMTDDGTYIVVEDIIMRQMNPFNLPAGDSVIIKVPANGSTWRIEAGQALGYPEHDFPSAVQEACGGLTTPGMVNSFALNEVVLYRDIDCNEVSAAFDPNDKSATPTGYNPDHIIRANTDLEYKIRFQNTGTDTAFTVVVVDTLSPLLDPLSIEAGVSSHPYRLDIYETGILNFVFSNIILPDSAANEAASHGFVIFRVAQKPDLPDGTIIENTASIYFDSNEPVATNTTFHTIGAPYIVLLLSDGNLDLPEVGVTVRPNPFRDGAVLDVTGHDMSEGLLRLYNAQGRLVQSQNFEGNQCKIEGEKLLSGVYYFQITDQGVTLQSGTVQVH